MDERTTWRKEITEELQSHNENWDDVVSCTLTNEQLDKTFYSGYGGNEGDPFTVWTVNRVYFPVCYDGAEWVGSVSRHPDGHPTKHQGGG